MIAFPNAKINLGLNVIRRRNDGFHDISSIFYPVMWHDILEIVPSGQFSFQSSGLKIPGDEKNNLCIKAYHFINDEYRVGPVEINLHKQIPMGAGLGGGSADGAFTIRLLNDLFHLNLSTEKLKIIASSLGSDCPFFIDNTPCIASGRGTDLEPVPIDLSSYQFLIIHTGLHISTAEAYSGVIPGLPAQLPPDIVLNFPLYEWKNILVNDFEKPAFEKFPLLKEIKENLYRSGAVYASMTGSGSAMYGIFEKKNKKPESLFAGKNYTLKWV